MRAGVGYSEIPDSVKAGTQAAQSAIDMAGREDPCEFVLLFCTARHDLEALREAVTAVVGEVPVYGGGAAGVITNNAYGYAGYQVGVACIWLEGASLHVLTDDGLLMGEEETGKLLGQGLARLGVEETSSVMLLYEAVGQNDETGVRLMMATWILAGLEKALGFLPNLSGAGLMGDHACSYTPQFTGDKVSEHSAMVFVCDNDIHVDSVIMHGCVPASDYYTVTKAEGPLILEINNKPALAFMDELLGSAITPEQYPFFLLFGVNHGARWGKYNEDHYASRLCLDIDKERGGIVMFEPDMVAGTEFRLMFRSFDLHQYMKPKLESLFNNLNGRVPVFATYIDCAGRCAGYSGTDTEDALLLQEVVGDRVPVLGIYSGVEIAPMAGRPRELDWSGIFCLFSQGEETAPPAENSEADELPKAAPVHDAPAEILRGLCEQNAAKALALDKQAIDLRYELELKRRGFLLLSELAVSLRQTNEYESMFIHIAQRINAALNMQKTIMLVSDGVGKFDPVVLQGFSPAEQDRLRKRNIQLPMDRIGQEPVLVTSRPAHGYLARLREEYDLPFFISAPILLQDEVVAVLLTGRMVEQQPYFTRLSNSDLETVRAIAEVLGSTLVHQRLADVTLKAETDGLTELWNRNTFQRKVNCGISESEGNAGVFMMIDIDYFKTINDTYGHIAGDKLLKDCADALRHVFRDSDIIGRLGGDEFAVFCPGIKNSAAAEKKAAQLLDEFRKIMPENGLEHMTASIGIAICPQQGGMFQELYQNADVAMYKAKQQGRDCYMLFRAN